MKDEITLEELRQFKFAGEFILAEPPDDSDSETLVVLSLRHSGGIVFMETGALMDAGNLHQRGWRFKRMPIGAESIMFPVNKGVQSA